MKEECKQYIGKKRREVPLRCLYDDPEVEKFMDEKYEPKKKKDE